MKKESLCIHAGWVPGNGQPRSMPIIQSTTFQYDSSEHMGRLFDLEEDGYFYSRLQNPTNDMVADKIAKLEGGVAAMLTSSGQSATFMAVFNICEAGNHVLASSALYGGSSNLFLVTMKKMGISCTLFDPDSSKEEILAAAQDNTTCIFAESISNPSLVVLDIEKLAACAREIGVPLIIDNTFATPFHCNPFQFGADIVTHSTSKYMDGHGSCIGGAIVDSGNFPWDRYPDKFPGLCQPDPSYHGVIYTEKFQKLAYIKKATVQLMRDLGCVQAPQNAFYLNLGLESLPLRIQRHSDNAKKIAKFLSNHPKIAWVRTPELSTDPYYELAQKYMPSGTCGVIAFGVQGDQTNAVCFMDHLQMISIATHVADAKTCILHPASHTHRQLTKEQLIDAGVKPDLIRLSVGLEDPDDLIEDLSQALEAIH